MTELAAAEANYFEAWRVLVRGAQGGLVEETDDVLFTSVALPAAYFNSAFVKPPARVADCVDEIVSFYAARKSPFTIRYREDDEGAAAACEARGLQSGGGTPVMFGDAASMAGQEACDVRAVDEALLSDYRVKMASGFEIPEAALAAIITPAALHEDSFVALLGFVGDEPVASAAVVVTGDCAGVYNIGTPPAQRKKGYGEALTRAAIAEGVRRGCTTTTLQASAMGFSIYERMGYRTLTTWRNHTGEGSQ